MKNKKHRGSSKKRHHLYQDHPSMTNVKDMKSKNISSFSFQPVSINKVEDKTKTVNTKKLVQMEIYL